MGVYGPFHKFTPGLEEKMFTVKKTFDEAELRGQELVLEIVKHWSEKLRQGLPVSFIRLDIKSHTKPNTLKYARVFGSVEYSGLVLVGNVTMRFNCRVTRLELLRYEEKGWKYDFRSMSSVGKGFELRIEGTDINGYIWNACFQRDRKLERWIVSELESTTQLRNEVAIRLR